MKLAFLNLFIFLAGTVTLADSASSTCVAVDKKIYFKIENAYDTSEGMWFGGFFSDPARKIEMLDTYVSDARAAKQNDLAQILTAPTIGKVTISESPIRPPNAPDIQDFSSNDLAKFSSLNLKVIQHETPGTTTLSGEFEISKSGVDSAHNAFGDKACISQLGVFLLHGPGQITRKSISTLDGDIMLMFNNSGHGFMLRFGTGQQNKDGKMELSVPKVQ